LSFLTNIKSITNKFFIRLSFFEGEPTSNPKRNSWRPCSKILFIGRRKIIRYFRYFMSINKNKLNNIQVLSMFVVFTIRNTRTRRAMFLFGILFAPTHFVYCVRIILIQLGKAVKHKGIKFLWRFGLKLHKNGNFMNTHT